MRIVAFLLLLLLSSCNCNKLCIREEFFTKEDLASVKVNTPDPSKESFQGGKRLIVYWRLPHTLKKSRKELILTVRFFSGEEGIISHQIDGLSSYYIYSLFDKEYRDKKGIETYKAEIIVDGESYAIWRHQVWSERIIWSQT